MIVYSLFAILISNSLPNKYGAELNDKRSELGIKPITENWTLDSIVLQSPVRGTWNVTILDTTDYQFLEKKRYCQYWTNQNVDKTKPYHKSKKIYFTKSFWIWKNEIDIEYDTFINPSSKLAEYEQLETTTFWQNGEEIYIHLTHMKNGENLFTDLDSNQPMYGFEKSKVDSILNEWNLK